MLRRQCGVPAFSNNPAFASRGTTHCSKFPKLESDCWSLTVRDTTAYTARMQSQIPTRMEITREEDILALRISLGGKCHRKGGLAMDRWPNDKRSAALGESSA